MKDSNEESFEMDTSVTSSSASGRTFNSSFSTAAEQGREILLFLKHSRRNNYDISSDLDHYETSTSSEIEVDDVSPETYQRQNRFRKNETFVPHFGVVKDSNSDSDSVQHRLRADMNKMTLENYRVQTEIHSARELNATLNKKLEHIMEKLRDHKLQKKTYLHRIEVLKQEVVYLKNELQECHSHSKSAHEREYELESQLRGLQRKHEQIFKDYVELKETVAALKEKLGAKEFHILQLKESEEKHFELEETWKLERDSLIRAYEACLSKNEQLDKMHEKVQTQLENTEEQFSSAERVLRQRIDELERREESKEEEMEYMRKEHDLLQNELQQVKKELALKIESIRSYETQLICSEEELKFSKESAARLQQQLQDWFQKREQLESRLEEREKQYSTLYSENVDLRRTLKEYQNKLFEQTTEVEHLKLESRRNIENCPVRMDATQQTDTNEEMNQNNQDEMLSCMKSLFLDTIQQLQVCNADNLRSTNKRGRSVTSNENIATSHYIVKDSGFLHFPFESTQVCDLPSIDNSQARATERDFDNLLNNRSSAQFCVDERKDYPKKNKISQIHEWKLKLMEWKILVDVNMRKEFLSVFDDQDIVARVDRLSEDLFLVLSILERFQRNPFPASCKEMGQNSSSKFMLNSDQENIALGAILTHIHQLRNLWLYEMEVNHILRSMLLYGNSALSQCSWKFCEFPQFSSEYSCFLDSDLLDQETLE